jgi:hypothetical protein
MQAQEVAAGTLVEVGGLLPIEANGALVTLSDGAVTTTDGPFVEAKELVGGYAVYDVATVEEAVERSRAFLQLHHDTWPGWEGFVQVRAIFEAPGA